MLHGLVTLTTILKDMKEHLPSLSATLGKYEKLTPLDALKYISIGSLH